MIEAQIIPAEISVSVNGQALNITPETQIVHDWHVPSNYGLITWNGAFLTVS